MIKIHTIIKLLFLELIYCLYLDNIVKTTDSSGINLSSINSYRYRSYRYDTETGFYYLNQRYYNPKIARFISQDDTGFLNPNDSRGMNLYG